MIVPDADRTRIDEAAAASGLEVDEIREDRSAGTWRVTVVVDGDDGVDLDALAELSRVLDPLAETWGAPSQTTVLEVTSRGVDAPLTAPRHWRRARGRKVEIAYRDASDGGPTAARVGDVSADESSVRLVRPTKRGPVAESVGLDRIARAVVTVEFAPAPAEEMAALSADRGAE